MSSDEKKFSFSFSKVKKPNLVKKVNVEPKEKIDYVDCFDGSKGKFSYKGSIRNEETVKQELVIPMPSNKRYSEIIKYKIEEKTKKLEGSGKVETSEVCKTSQQNSNNLEELAASEILNDIKNVQTNYKTIRELIIETKELPAEAIESDIDYDNVPVGDFGLALLRGMGWRPDQGIGKEPRVVEAASPNLRPRGLGLGANLTTKPSNTQDNNRKNWV